MAALGAWAAWGCLAVALSWCLARRHSSRLVAGIPGPRGWPLLGNMLQLIARREDVLNYFKELHDRYATVVKMWVGPLLCVGIADPQDIRVILSSSKTVNKPVMYNPVSTAFGNSLLTAKFKEWKKFRQIMEPTFVNRVIDSYVSTFHEKSQRMADLLEECCHGEPFNMADYTLPCALEMLSETSLGVPMNIQDEGHQHILVENYPKITDLATHSMSTPWMWFHWTSVFFPFHNKINALVKPIHEYVTSLIKDKTEKYISSRNHDVAPEASDIDVNVSNVPKNRLGLLEHMVSTMVDNPELLSIEELQDQAVFVIGAGTDTTAYTAATTLMLLGLHQDVQRQVLQEQASIFGEDTSRPVTTTDLKQMVYLEQVINETMRLYPVLPLIGRRVDEDVGVNSYTLPAGTTVVIPIYLVHRNPQYFPNPESFDPDRFSRENSASRHACSFIPFSYGRKMCLGKSYAYMSMKTMLSVLLRRYEVLEYGSRDDMECFKFKFFLKFKHGHIIRLRRRTCVIKKIV